MEQVEDVREREGAGVGAEHEVAVPGKGSRFRRTDPFQQDRAAAGFQQADRLALGEAEQGSLFR